MNQGPRRICLVSEKKWITGGLAIAIACQNPDLPIDIVDVRDANRTPPDSLFHLLLWGAWQPAMKDGFLLTVHHLDDGYSGYDLFKAYEVVRRASLIFVPCAQTHDFLRRHFGIPGSIIKRIPYGIDLSRFRPGSSSKTRYGIAENRRVIGNISSLHPRKGVIHLCRAFRQLATNYPDLHLLLVAGKEDLGSREEKRSLEAEIAAMPDRVTFLQPDQAEAGKMDAGSWADLYRAMDVYCSPSFIEGGPVPAMEAMASGVPVVLSRTGMGPALIRRGGGVLISAGDEADIARGIGRVLRCRERMSSAALKAIQAFDISRYAGRHRPFYFAALNGKRAPLPWGTRSPGRSIPSPVPVSHLPATSVPWGGLIPPRPGNTLRILVIQASPIDSTVATAAEAARRLPASEISIICREDCESRVPGSIRAIPLHASRLLPQTLGLHQTADLARRGFDLILVSTRLHHPPDPTQLHSYSNLVPFLEEFPSARRMLVFEDGTLHDCQGLMAGLQHGEP